MEFPVDLYVVVVIGLVISLVAWSIFRLVRGKRFVARDWQGKRTIFRYYVWDAKYNVHEVRADEVLQGRKLVFKLLGTPVAVFRKWQSWEKLR